MAGKQIYATADDSGNGDVEAGAYELAEQICKGFVYHDQRRRAAALDAFWTVDEVQFAHLDEQEARQAAMAYVNALWAKDAVERSCMENGELDREALADADWSSVNAAFARRATTAGIDPRYADCSTLAWKRHKIGGDYWTPLQRAQMYELRTALRDHDYPHKPRYGQSGYGPEPMRYVLGVELHDMRRVEEGIEAMVPYFERILNEHRSE